MQIAKSDIDIGAKPMTSVKENLEAYALACRKARADDVELPTAPGADLSGADLSGARLSGADLSGADLSGADLYGARLSGAGLYGADLSGADLSWAKLSRADLSEADFSGAKLSGADLSGADLSWAKLSRADLSGADLSGADLSGADLSGASVRDTKFDFTGVTKIGDLHTKILEAIKDGSELDMNDWHTCATTHCRAGWAVHLAGADGYALEAELGPRMAGSLITLASCPWMERVPDFYASNEDALSDIKACAEIEANRRK